MSLPPELEAELERRESHGLDGGPLDILCAACRAPVTGRDRAMLHAGAHRHFFRNPSGITFEVGLYREATCPRTGKSTPLFTWFAGYAWQIACCGGCELQLGWHYTGGDGAFYGLIVDRLLIPQS